MHTLIWRCCADLERENPLCCIIDTGEDCFKRSSCLTPAQFPGIAHTRQRLPALSGSTLAARRSMAWHPATAYNVTLYYDDVMLVSLIGVSHEWPFRYFDYRFSRICLSPLASFLVLTRKCSAECQRLSLPQPGQVLASCSRRKQRPRLRANGTPLRTSPSHAVASSHLAQPSCAPRSHLELFLSHWPADSVASV